MIRTVFTFCVILSCAFEAVSKVVFFKDIPGCALTEAEKCGLDFVPFFVSPRLAETAKELQDHCKLYKEQLQCIDNFSDKCLQGLPKGVVSLMIDTASDEFDILCNTTTTRYKEYLDSATCINKAGPDVQTCMQDFFVALHRASTAPVNKQIGYSCCYYQDFVECAEKRLTTNCELPTAIKFFNVVIENVLGEGFSFACGKYKKGSGACERLPTLSKKNDSNARGKGFIGPLVSIAGNVG